MQLFSVTGLRNNWPRSLRTPKHLSSCSALISRIYPHFYDPYSSQDLRHLLSRSLSFQDHFFLGSHLFGFLCFPAPQACDFPKLNSLKQKHNILTLSQACLLIRGHGTCHYFLVHVIKIYNQPILITASK